LVARPAEGAGHAPQGFELELAVGLAIGANPAPLVFIDCSGVGAFDRSVGDEAAQLERADAVEIAIFRLERRIDAAVHMRRDGEVAVGRDLPMVRDRELGPFLSRVTDVRDEPAGDSIVAGADAEHWKQRQVDSEQLQPPSLEANALMGWIIDHFDRGDGPARPARAAGWACHRARRINRVLKSRDISAARST